MTTKIDILQQLKSRGNPLIEGDRVTFYWQGDSPPLLLDELHGWEEGDGQRLKRVPARLARGAQPPLWSTSFTLPQDAYLEYSFYDPYNRDHLADPFNPRTCNNGMGGRNHFFYMPGAAPTPLAVRRNRVKHGTIMRRMVDTWLLVDDGQREVHFYQPPVEQPAPLLVVYDGTDYLQRGRLATIVDNLIAEGRIRPLAMAFLQNGGRRRSVEYACSDATIAWLDRIVLPRARRHLNLLDVKS